MQEKLEVREIKLSPNLDPIPSFYDCHFCGKQINTEDTKYLVKLPGDSFYCDHCLRQGFHAKSRRNVLITSFRPLFGYYYQNFYQKSPRKIWHADLKDLHELHCQTGLRMPVFSYDAESMLWFVDYNKIGRGRKKIPHREILNTITNIIACFDLETILAQEQVKTAKLVQKYHQAMDEFYQHRHRPDNKKILMPTLVNCIKSSANLESTKSFTFRKIFG